MYLRETRFIFWQKGNFRRLIIIENGAGVKLEQGLQGF
jgi:hypothetical protein